MSDLPVGAGAPPGFGQLGRPATITFAEEEKSMLNEDTFFREKVEPWVRSESAHVRQLVEASRRVHALYVSRLSRLPLEELSNWDQIEESGQREDIREETGVVKALLRARMTRAYHNHHEPRAHLAYPLEQLRKGSLELRFNHAQLRTADNHYIELDLAAMDSVHPELQLLAETSTRLFEEVLAEGGRFINVDQDSDSMAKEGRKEEKRAETPSKAAWERFNRNSMLNQPSPSTSKSGSTSSTTTDRPKFTDLGARPRVPSNSSGNDLPWRRKDRPDRLPERMPEYYSPRRRVSPIGSEITGQGRSISAGEPLMRPRFHHRSRLQQSSWSPDESDSTDFMSADGRDTPQFEREVGRPAKSGASTNPDESFYAGYDPNDHQDSTEDEQDSEMYEMQTLDELRPPTPEFNPVTSNPFGYLADDDEEGSHRPRSRTEDDATDKNSTVDNGRQPSNGEGPSPAPAAATGSWVQIAKKAQHAKQQFVATPQRISAYTNHPHVYMDVSLGGREVGRVEFRLRADLAKRTCEMFVKRCDERHPLTYKGTRFFHSKFNQYVMGGQFTGKGADEQKARAAFIGDQTRLTDEVGAVRMVCQEMTAEGTCQVDSHFLVWTSQIMFKTWKSSLVFGKVTKGLKLLNDISKSPKWNTNAAKFKYEHAKLRYDIKVVNCGVLV